MNWSVFFRLVFQKKKTFCLKNALLKKERGLIRFPLIKDKFQLCAQLRVCSQAGGIPVYPRFSQPDNSESWDDAGNGI